MIDDPSALPSYEILCPYCGERISVMTDAVAVPDEVVERQRWIEDCSVCCKPIELSLAVDADGDTTVVARRDDE